MQDLVKDPEDESDICVSIDAGYQARCYTRWPTQDRKLRNVNEAVRNDGGYQVESDRGVQISDELGSSTETAVHGNKAAVHGHQRLRLPDII